MGLFGKKKSGRSAARDAKHELRRRHLAAELRVRYGTQCHTSDQYEHIADALLALNPQAIYPDHREVARG